MIAQIIPAKRMPLSLPFLDYNIPEKDAVGIKIGQLVKIPFRQKEEFGVIFNLKNSSVTDAKLKPIKEVVFARPIISKEQLDFLQHISEFYHVSLGFLLKTNLIPLQPRKIQKIKTYDSTSVTVSASNTQHLQAKPELYLYKNQLEKSEIIIKKISASGQTLILVPEISAIEKIINILPSSIAEKTAVITSNLSTKELFSLWLEIWNGKKQIVIGTRSALFLPWTNLQQIILDDEGNPNYKSWDMAPRLHTRDGALFLAKSHGARTSLLTHTPSVETLFFGQKNVYAGENIKLQPIYKPVQIIDMRAQRRLKNFSLLSHDALAEYKKITEGDIFFFINRRGTVSYVGCRDCGQVLACPNCHLALTYHQDTNQLRCHYCHHKEPLPLECKKCQGTNVAMYGAGTQLAEDLVRKITPKNDVRHIIRIDSDEHDVQKLKKEGDKIIIGTQLAWPHVDWKKVRLLVFLDADAALFIPEYKVTENVWQQIRDAQFNLPLDAQLLIQTSHPEHVVFSSLFDPQSFYTQQLAERKALGYPPFKFLLKMMHGYDQETVVINETKKMIKQLADLTKNSAEITILGPWEASPYYYNGQYWQVILAKITYENYKKNTKLLLSKTPDNWKIDPNPNSILYFS